MDKIKHFLACFTIASAGAMISPWVGLYGAMCAAITREFDKWDYLKIFDGKDSFFDMFFGLLGAVTGILIVRGIL